MIQSNGKEKAKFEFYESFFIAKLWFISFI